MQYQSSCAPKLDRKCEIEHWLPCGGDGRAAGRAVCGHVITKFSGMGRVTYPWCSAGALRAPERRYNFSDYSPHPIWLFFFSRKNSLAWGVKCEKFNVVALIPIFASINEFIIAKEQTIWLYQILLANISW